MVQSPCTKVCKIDGDRRLCIGCWRTLDEIAAWLDMSDAQRLETIACAERRQTSDEG